MTSPPSPQDLDARFMSHAIDSGQAAGIAELRASFRAVAEQIVDVVPPGREQSIALTKLEECSFYSIAGVARRSA